LECYGGLWETLKRRRTTRTFASTPLSFDELSLILRYTFGCRGYNLVGEGAAILSKTSPSGGAMHPTEVYVLARNVEALEPGLYHYGVQRHELELLTGFTSDECGSLAKELSSGQGFLREAPALFLLTARFFRNFWKYRRQGRAYAVLLMDSAHLAQTFYLVCAELRLGAFVTAAVNGTNIEKRLGLDPFTEGALMICACGRPADLHQLEEVGFEAYVPRETTI